MSDDEKTEATDAQPQGWLTTKRRVSIAIGVLVIVAIALMVVNQLIKSKSTDRVPLPAAITAVEISSPGKITLTDATSQPEVVRTSKYVFKKPGSSFKIEDGVLKLKGSCGGLRLGGCSVDYIVPVPAGVSVVVKNSSGAVDIDGVKSDVKVTTKSGSVSIDESYGRLEIETAEGTVSGTSISSRDVDVQTKTGAVSLRFAAAPSDVDVESDDGVVTVQVPKSQTTYNVDASSLSGKTTTEIPRDSSSPFKIRARSDSGAVTVETK